MDPLSIAVGASMLIYVCLGLASLGSFISCWIQLRGSLVPLLSPDSGDDILAASRDRARRPRLQLRRRMVAFCFILLYAVIKLAEYALYLSGGFDIEHVGLGSIMFLVIPLSLLFTCYTSMVLFWAKLMDTAKSQTILIELEGPLYFVTNLSVYLISLSLICLYSAGTETSNPSIENCGPLILFIARVTFASLGILMAGGFAVYGRQIVRSLSLAEFGSGHGYAASFLGMVFWVTVTSVFCILSQSALLIAEAVDQGDCPTCFSCQHCNSWWFFSLQMIVEVIPPFMLIIVMQDATVVKRDRQKKQKINSMENSYRQRLRSNDESNEVS